MFCEQVRPYLDKYLEGADRGRIGRLLRYSLLGGKGIRGYLVKHIIETLLPGQAAPWECVAAVELIHAASLVVDDLPCMDDDSVRRGKAAAHLAFGKHEAILSSFYIVAESVRILFGALRKRAASANATEEALGQYNTLITEWCDLLGRQLVVGQMLDLGSDAEEMLGFTCPVGDPIEKIIQFKTCSLFSFAFALGSVFGGRSESLAAFKEMGFHFGLMFQLLDDLKDVGKDDPSVNYVLARGWPASLKRYVEAREKLVTLLSKEGLYTPEFARLIAVLDSRFTGGRAAGAPAADGQ